MKLVKLLLLMMFSPITKAALNTNELLPSCKPTDSICKFPKLVVETQLSMAMYDESTKSGSRTFVDEQGAMYYKQNCQSTVKKYLSSDETDSVNAADGTFRYITTINGQFPGPSLVVYEGQTVEVTFVNKFHQQGLAVHFHGQVQRCTNWMDGVPGLTQCAFNPGEAFTYRFTADPVGTHWYHSHQGFQLNDGMYGAFIVLPKSRNSHHGHNIKKEFIMAFQTFMPLNHNHAFTSRYQGFAGLRSYLYYGQCPGMENNCTGRAGRDIVGRFTALNEFYSALVNGKGRRYNQNGEPIDLVPLETYTVESGKFYKFRLINAGDAYNFKVSIDQHKLLVTNAEVGPIEPIWVDSIILHAAERYEVIIEATQSIDNYWIRIETLEVPNPHFTKAILRYDGASNTDPTSQERRCTPGDKCKVLGCPYLLVPPYSDTTECINIDQLQNPDGYKVTPVQTESMLQFSITPTKTGNRRNTINGIMLDPPTVPPAILGHTKYENPCTVQSCDPACSCTPQIDIPLHNTVQYTFFSKDSSHPVHMHGYLFYVLKIGYPTYDADNKMVEMTKDITCIDESCNNARWTDSSWYGGNIPGLNLVSPIAKDTVTIPAGGYVVVRFVADNPGWWFLHCHIDPHLGDGMALIQQVGDPEQMVPAPPTMHLCGEVTEKEMDRTENNKKSNLNFIRSKNGKMSAVLDNVCGGAVPGENPQKKKNKKGRKKKT